MAATTGEPLAIRTDHSRLSDGQTSFVGRVAESVWIDELIEDVLSGSPRLAIVMGEPGVGKSRLVREALARIGPDAKIVACRCRESMSTALSAFDTSLFPLLIDDARSRGDDHATEHLEGLLKDMGAVDDQGGSDRAHQLLVRAASLTIDLTHGGPVVIFIDDLHWADSSSLDLIEYIASQLTDRSMAMDVPILVVATTRPPVDHSTKSTIERLGREPICSMLQIKGLPRLDVAEMAGDLAGRSLTERELSAIVSSTRGNPLFVEAIVNAATIRSVSGGQAAAEHRLPLHIHEALAEPLRQLPAEAAATLKLAAFLGNSMEFSDLSKHVSVSDSELRRHLGLAHQSGLLNVSGTTWTFAHDLYQRSAYEETPAAEAEELHHQIASALAKSDVVDHRELAHHLRRSGALANKDELYVATANAGMMEFNAGNWTEAASHLYVAIELRDRYPDLAETEVIDQTDLLHHLGHSLINSGEPERGFLVLQRAITALDQLSDSSKRLRVLISFCRGQVGSSLLGKVIDDAELEAAVTTVEKDDPALAAEAMATLAQNRWLSGNIPQAIELAEKALVLADGTNVDAEILACLTLAMTKWVQFDLAGACQILERADRSHDAATQPAGRTGAANRLSINQLWMGDINGATATMQRALTVGESINYTREIGLPLTAGAMGSALRGDLQSADQQLTRALRFDRLTGYSWATMFALPLLAVVNDLLDHHEKARSLLDELGSIMGEQGKWTQTGRVMHAAERARRTDSEPAEALINSGTISMPTVASLGSVGLAAALADLAAAVDDPALAKGAVSIMREGQNRGLIYIGATATLLSRAVGVALVLDGDIDAGIEELYKARSRALADEARLELAHTTRDLAWALARRGVDGDDDASVRLDLSYRAQLDELGLGHRIPPIELTKTGVGTQSADGQATRIVLFVDVSRSTELVEQMGDIVYAHRLRSLLSEIYLVVARHGGRVVNHTGDGALVTFDSATAALACAHECHLTAQRSRLRLHVGAHAGDVVELDGNIFGGVVNTAARLCDVANQDATVVSGVVRTLAKGTSWFEFESIGTHSLKGLSEPIELFAISVAMASATSQDGR